MALVVFLRGVNVGGHRRFRPSTLAAELKHLGAVNIGAAGTLVIRARITRAKLRAELARRLPFETTIAVCDGRDVSRLIDSEPYRGERARPDVVRCAVMIATYGRSGPLQTWISEGERQIYDQKITLPPHYHAAITAHLNLSRHTLDDDTSVRDWLDVIEFSGQTVTPGMRAQLGLHDGEADRLAAYAGITRPSLVIGFADDRSLPPHLAREVADAIPGARYEEVAKAGHYGYLEQPAEVNALLIEFLAQQRD